MKKLIVEKLSTVRTALRFLVRTSFIAVLSITLISTLLIYPIIVTALEDSSLVIERASSQEDLNNEPLGENEKLMQEEIEIPEKQIKIVRSPDFSDEQVFPFVAGLDSYE